MEQMYLQMIKKVNFLFFAAYIGFNIKNSLHLLGFFVSLISWKFLLQPKVSWNIYTYIF